MILAWVVGLAVLPPVLGEYYVGLAATVGINVILALGLILVTGYAGQFSLAQAAFFGLGAYGSALLTVRIGIPSLLALAISAVGCLAVALLIGRPVFRLRGHFLAMGTLALVEICYLLFNNLSITGGSSGFGGIEPLSIAGFSFASLESQFWLIWIVVGVILWGSLKIRRSREGRALRALRGHEAAAASCGVNVSWSKTKVFAASAFIGSVAGSLYAHQLLYVNPPPFDFSTSLDILAIGVLGGLATPWGAIIGSVAFEGIRQGINSVLPSIFGPQSVGAGESLIFGAILVIILVLRPDGIAGVVSWLAAKVRRRSATIPETTEVSVASDVRPTPGEVVLEARGLTKRFGGVVALDNVDLTLRQSEILAVIGPNGAGKSTLINLISGNLAPTAGSVTIAGKDVTGRAAHRVAAAGLARTFQTPSLFRGMTTREHVMVGSYLRGKVGLLRASLPTIGAAREERTCAEDADEILRDLGLSALADLDATTLSLGQQKMVEVARALAHHPTVLLLDEPGAGLTRVDKQNLARTLSALRARGIALLLIEHDMEFVMSLADRVHVLDFGRSLTEGTPKQVQANEAVIDAYLGRAHHGDSDSVEALDARP